MSGGNGKALAKRLLNNVTGYGNAPRGPKPPAQDRPPKMGTVDPAYIGSGPAKVTFDGETSMSSKAYVVVGIAPAASDRVVLFPVGKTYIIVGTLGGRGTTAAIVALGQVFTVQGQYASGITGDNGATFTSGSFVKRALNTTIVNSIVGASVAASVVTLPAGTYDVTARCPSFAVGLHKSKLRQTSGVAADLLLGSQGYSPSSLADAFDSNSLIDGRITLAGTTTIELQHRCTTTRASNGFGVAATYGVNEVYSSITFTKIA